MNPLARQTNRWLEPFDLLSDHQDDFGRLFSPGLHTHAPNGGRHLASSFEILEAENQFT